MQLVEFAIYGKFYREILWLLEWFQEQEKAKARVAERNDLEEDPEIEGIEEEEEEEDDYDVNEEPEQLEDAEPAQHNAAAADVMGAQIAAVDIHCQNVAEPAQHDVAAADVMGVQIAADIHCQDDGDEDVEDTDDKQLLIP